MSECQCLGSLNHLGKSHRSAGPKRFNVMMRDPYSEFSRPLQVASPDCANRYSTSFEPANEWAALIRVVLLTLWSDMRGKSRKQKQSLNIESPVDFRERTGYGNGEKSTLHSNHLQGDKVKGSQNPILLTFMNNFI